MTQQNNSQYAELNFIVEDDENDDSGWEQQRNGVRLETLKVRRPWNSVRRGCSEVRRACDWDLSNSFGRGPDERAVRSVNHASEVHLPCK